MHLPVTDNLITENPTQTRRVGLMESDPFLWQFWLGSQNDAQLSALAAVMKEIAVTPSLKMSLRVLMSAGSIEPSEPVKDSDPMETPW